MLLIVTYLIASMGVWPLSACPSPPSLSTAGDAIDDLYNGLNVLAMVVLLGTGGLVGYVLWRFDHRRSLGSKAKYFTHHMGLEIIWTFVPGAVLVVLAFYQIDAWATHKMIRPIKVVNGVDQEVPPLVLVKAKQFGWEFHYPGDDGRIKTSDDMYVEGLLVVPCDQDVVLQLESRDVIHSFWVPDLRLKQDVVPGLTQFVWFRSNHPAEVDIFCTELCGWGHYQMKATLRIVPQEQFDHYIERLQATYEAPIATARPISADGAKGKRGEEGVVALKRVGDE